MIPPYVKSSEIHSIDLNTCKLYKYCYDNPQILIKEITTADSNDLDIEIHTSDIEQKLYCFCSFYPLV